MLNERIELTWNQFKQHIDMLLDAKGISRDSAIDYIDVRCPVVVKIGEEDTGMTSPYVCYDDSGISIS